MNLRLFPSPLHTPTGRKTATLPALALAAALVLSVAGCATEVGLHTFLKQPYPAKPDGSPIEVFTNSLPTRAFERVALLDAHCESQGYRTPTLKHDGLPMLLQQARAAGCDAIIEIEEVTLPGDWTLETRAKQFSAIGIAYK